MTFADKLYNCTSVNNVEKEYFRDYNELKYNKRLHKKLEILADDNSPLSIAALFLLSTMADNKKDEYDYLRKMVANCEIYCDWAKVKIDLGE